jgi:ABC-type transport system substrate-binding protein
MNKGLIAFVSALSLLVVPGSAAFAQKTGGTPILSGPLVRLDIKEAQIEPKRGEPRGTLTVAQHFALDPGWLNPVTHSYVLTQVHYDYLAHDALIKSMPQGVLTYSLAEHAELTADFKQAAFRLRAGLKFQDGTPLTTADVKWTYENFKGAYAKIFHDKTESIKIVDDRTIIFNFKEPFLDFVALYNGITAG